MKNIIITLTILISITLVSCKKEYVCSCTATTSGSTTTAETYSGAKLSKKDAQSWCEKNNTNSGAFYTVTCKLK